MFEELVGSRVRRQVGPMRGLVVAALHGVVIAGAIRTTAVARPTPVVKIDTTRFILATVEPVTSASSVSDPTAISAEPVPVELLAPPVEMPTGLPPIVPGPALDPERLRHIIGLGIPGARADSTAIVGVLAAFQVDEPAAAVYQPSPRYPAVLQQAGLEGRVTVEFVIDTLGRLEPASFRVLSSTNPGFNAAAQETVQRSVFRPARIKGGAVRQRTTQAIVFRIAPT